MRISNKIILLLILSSIISELIYYTETSSLAISASINSSNVANVGVLLYDFNDPYIFKLKEDLENIQKENPKKIKFNFFDGKNNISTQSAQLDSVLNDNIDLLIIALADSREDIVKDILYKVKPKDIPLILTSIDKKLIPELDTIYDKVVSVNSNAEQAGIMESKILSDIWMTNKKIIDKNNDNILQYIIITGKTNSPLAKKRTSASIAALKNFGINTQQLFLSHAGWSQSLAKTAIKSLFLRYGNKIEAIIANNDAMAIGAIEALQEYGYNSEDKTKYVQVVGIDGLPEAKTLINNGVMAGTVIQDSKTLANALYAIGMNLINKFPPTENTNYNVVDGEIIVPFTYEEYIKK
ncbi:galactose ABC transporter substrate-binding protein [Clostridium beijerinckii]|uniref:galactose ABC transporter substrate-binding protein n=1 Tax=Clostridium beijerinckii TaxID=1520 RepID=UPI00098C20F5|nr:galactose ABC transporter substrate-binding protein [Clostridium beijerinckii]NRT78437.1 methyl-galactoside transport system substrate-binding protein [Clostridium beijerinckii]OOM35739.1 D-galactose-binding periplasmic protein precursor [Clostridium beijerinckii]